MPDPTYTLLDAIRAAREQGGINAQRTGSSGAQASIANILKSFEAQPAPRQQAQPKKRGGFLGGLGGALKDIGGEALSLGFSGERLVKEAGRAGPLARALGLNYDTGLTTEGLPSPLRKLIDIGLAPATLATAGGGSAITSLGARTPGLLGMGIRAAGPVLDVAPGTGAGTAFGQRMAGETLTGLGSMYGSELLGKVAPDNTYAKIGAGLVGGLAGGVTGATLASRTRGALFNPKQFQRDVDLIQSATGDHTLTLSPEEMAKRAPELSAAIERVQKVNDALQRPTKALAEAMRQVSAPESKYLSPDTGALGELDLSTLTRNPVRGPSVPGQVRRTPYTGTQVAQGKAAIEQGPRTVYDAYGRPYHVVDSSEAKTMLAQPIVQAGDGPRYAKPTLLRKDAVTLTTPTPEEMAQVGTKAKNPFPEGPMLDQARDHYGIKGKVITPPEPMMVPSPAMDHIDDIANTVHAEAVTAHMDGTPPPTIPVDSPMGLPGDEGASLWDLTVQVQEMQAVISSPDGKAQVESLFATDPRELIKRSHFIQDLIDKLPDTPVSRALRGIGRAFIDPRYGKDDRVVHTFAIGQGFREREITTATVATNAVGRDFKTAFGDSLSKVEIREDAPQSARVIWDQFQTRSIQEGKPLYEGALFEMVGVHPEWFRNITPEQASWLKQYTKVLENDVKTSRDWGVDIDTTKGFYARRMTGLIINDGTNTPAPSELRQLIMGRERSYQMARFFDDIKDMLDYQVLSPDQKRIWLDEKITSIEQSKGSHGELAALREMRKHNLAITLKEGSFADAFSERMIQAANARADEATLQYAKQLDIAARTADPTHTTAIEDQVRGLVTENVNSIVRGMGEVTQILREMKLGADASFLTIQAFPAVVMDKGWAPGLRYMTDGTISTALSAEAHLRWQLANAPAISDAVLNGGLAMRSNILEKLDDGAAGITRIPFLGKAISKAEEIGYERFLYRKKLETYQNTHALLKSIQGGGRLEAFWKGLGKGQLLLTDPKTWTDADVARAAGNFTNNALGGLNMATLTKSKLHQTVESLIVLTPGFTRGTLGLGFKALGGGPEAALSRALAARGTALIAGLVTGLTLFANGVYDGKVVMPNIIDPSRDDWMDIPLPGGARIRPMSRFRSPAKIAVGNLMLASKDPITAAQNFTNESLQWASYRQSMPVTTILGDPIGGVFGQAAGNRYARDKGLTSLINNPSTSRPLDVMEFAGSAAPVILEGAMSELTRSGGLTPGALKNVSLEVVSQFFGQQALQPTSSQREIITMGAEKALAAGVPEDAVTLALRTNKAAFNAKGADGTYLLTREQRSAIVAEIATATGSDPKEVATGGFLQQQRDRASELKSAKSQQITDFFATSNTANEQYRAAVAQLDEGVRTGVLSLKDYSQRITDLRAQKGAIGATNQASNPVAMAFLKTGEWRNQRNGLDVAIDTLASDYYNPPTPFVDPATGEFDFVARAAREEMVKTKYGDELYDEWIKRRDAKKSPLELERDKASATLEPYYALGESLWAQHTKGTMGASKQEFESTLLAQFRAQGMDDATASVALQKAEQRLPSIKRANRAIERARLILRRQNPKIEEAITQWHGLQPLSARADRGYPSNGKGFTGGNLSTLSTFKPPKLF